MGYRNYADLQAAGSGSGYGGCYCPKEEESDLSDLGLLAAGAATVFLLYQAITMMAAGGGRKKRSEGTPQIKGDFGERIQDLFWKGRIH